MFSEKNNVYIILIILLNGTNHATIYLQENFDELQRVKTREKIKKTGSRGT